MIELCAHLPDVFEIRESRADRGTAYRLHQPTCSGSDVLHRPKPAPVDPDPYGIKAYSKAKKNVLLLLRHLKGNWGKRGCPVDRLQATYRDRPGFIFGHFLGGFLGH